MTDFDLSQQYDLIILGITSISLLLLEQQRKALFECVSKHLKPGGKFIFDMFDFSEERWKDHDGFSDVWSKESDDGQEFGIVGQKFYPEQDLFVFNVYREIIDWDGNTKRYIGTSTKAMLEEHALMDLLKSCGLKLVDSFHHTESKFFVSTLDGGINHA